jgi:hypothetical protein
MTLRAANKTIRFCFNFVSWDPDPQAPVPGGMASLLVAPILEHLESPYELANCPAKGRVNVYYSHRSQYPDAPRDIRDHEVGVFISHGIADKGWRDRVGNAYEHVFVSGPGWSRKMAENHCPIRRIVEAGYTKLDPIFQGRVDAPERDDRIRVVWAPTHGGGGMDFAFSKVPPPSRAYRDRTTWWDREHQIYNIPIGRHASTPDALADVVREAAVYGISAGETEFIEPILPADYRGISGRLHAEALDEIAVESRPVAPHPPSVRMLTYRHRSGRTVEVPSGTHQERTYAESQWWTPIAAG